mgnify:CR=1 FL=1
MVGSVMKFGRPFLSGAAFFISLLCGVEAAEFSVYGADGRGPAIVFVTGEIVPDDHKRFVAKTISLDEAIVVFSSPGGNLIAGVEIGKAIRLKDFTTYVPEGKFCTSACAIAWIGGTRRLMSRDARIGFHAAYRSTGGMQQESGMANAFVGAFFNSIGLPARTVMYLTSASPQEMRWLAPEDADDLGISVKIFELPSNDRMAETKRNNPLNSSGLERAAIEFARGFQLEASRGPQRSLELVRRTYDDSFVFYGKLIDKAKILAEKERYFNRWPLSIYTPLLDTLRASCDGRTCVVSGEVEFNSSDYEQKRRSAGRAEFIYGLRYDGSRFFVSSESGKVLQRY